MKHYIFSTIVGFTLMTTIWIVAFYYQLGVPARPGTDAAWISATYAKKISAANAINSRKILIVAGSSALFGISAAQIEQAINIPTINFGVHALMGLEQNLERAKLVAKPDDIILLALEYVQYKYNGHLNQVEIINIIAQDPANFHNLSINKKIEIMFSIPLKELLRRIYMRIYPPSLLLGQYTERIAYDPENFNKNGDVTLNKKKQKQLNALYNPERYKNFDKNATAWGIIADFYNWCKKNKIKVIVTFPSFLYHPDYNSKEEKEFFDYIVKYYQNLGVDILGTPYDFMYDNQFFYDSNYHLNDVGTRKHTNSIIVLLKELIKK
jgi:hypothetical protein